MAAAKLKHKGAEQAQVAAAFASVAGELLARRKIGRCKPVDRPSRYVPEHV
jgi:hypothetical protein